MKIRLEKSLAPNRTSQTAVPVIAVLLALVFCGLFLAATGRNPFEVYGAMFSGALGSEYGISETIVKTIPLALCGLGVARWRLGCRFGTLAPRGSSTWVPALQPGFLCPFPNCLFRQ